MDINFEKLIIGYINQSSSVEDLKEIARPSESNFNSAFLNNKKQMMNSVDPKYLQLMKRNDIPDERYTSHRGVTIGEEQDENTDFTGVAEGGSLNYTDIRRALELTHLVDEDDVDKKTSGDVMKDFSKMKSNGVDFLPTPTSYYKDLTLRVGNIDEDIEILQKNVAE